MEATIVELDARTGDEVAYGARDEHRAGCRERRHPGPDVDRQPSQLALHHFALAGVNAGPNLDAEISHSRDDRRRAPDGPSWPVERGQEPVAGDVDLSPAEPGQFGTDDGVVTGEEVPPLLVAERGSRLG